MARGQRDAGEELRQVIVAADLEVQAPLTGLEDLLVVAQDDVVRLGPRARRRRELVQRAAVLIVLELVAGVQVRAGDLGVNGRNAVSLPWPSVRSPRLPGRISSVEPCCRAGPRSPG